jgi:hypothetical protein
MALSSRIASEFSRRTLAAKSQGAQCTAPMLLAGGSDIVE